MVALITLVYRDPHYKREGSYALSIWGYEAYRGHVSVVKRKRR